MHIQIVPLSVWWTRQETADVNILSIILRNALRTAVLALDALHLHRQRALSTSREQRWLHMNPLLVIGDRLNVFLAAASVI